MEMEEVKSSMFSHVGHDPATNQLHVRFKNSGVEYVINEVSADEHKAFMSADSLGVHFNRHLRGKPNARKAPQVAGVAT